MQLELNVLGRLVYKFNESEDFKEECFLKLKDEMFQDTEQRVFKYLKNLNKINKPLDIGVLSEKLSKAGVEGTYLFDLIEKASYHDTILNEYLEAYERKQIALTCKKVLSKVENYEYDNQDLVNELQKLTIEEKDNYNSVVTGEQLLDDFEIEMYRDTQNMSTGFTVDKNDIIFERGDLVIIGARPAMGKTAYALNMFYNKIKNGEKGVFISLEMNNIQLTRRLLGISAKVETKYFKHKELYKKISPTDEIYEDIMFAKDFIKTVSDRFRIMNPKKNNINYIKNELKKIEKDLKGLDFIMVDYLGLLSVDSKTKSDTEKMNEVSLWAKAIAREFNCVTIGLQQINRGVEARADRRPTMGDLKQSGQFEQDASVIQLLYRDEYYNPDTELKGILEIINAKNRDGKVYSQYFKFDLEKQLIKE